jgi:dCMP deaminase
MSVRLSWEQYFMTITRQVAERSTCTRAKVGAVPHCTDVGCLIYESRTPNGETEQNCFRTIHAEMNAIAQAAKNGSTIKEAAIYITHTPCIHCLKVLVNTGIKDIFYEKPYKLHTLEELLSYTQVNLHKIELG